MHRLRHSIFPEGRELLTRVCFLSKFSTCCEDTICKICCLFLEAPGAGLFVNIAWGTSVWGQQIMLGHRLQHIHVNVIHMTGSSCARKQIKIKTNKSYRFKQVWNSWYSAEAKSYMTGGGICSLHSCAVITRKGENVKTGAQNNFLYMYLVCFNTRRTCLSRYQSCLQISYHWSLVLYLAWSFIPGPT